MAKMISAMVLTFHGIQQDKSFPEGTLNPAAKRYIIPDIRFKEAIEKISPNKCCTISEFINKKKDDWTILTFDDGLISDYKIAFPLLSAKGLRGTFFITFRNIGQIGYLSLDHLKEMIQGGMEIGSHGLTHRYLVTMPLNEAFQEIIDSKDRLEQKMGIEIKSFAPVGGHFYKWVTDVSFKAGYKAFATMIPGKTYSKFRRNKDIVILRRNHILTHHNAKYISGLCSGFSNILALNFIKYYLLSIPKTVLGMNNYDRTKELFFRTFSSLGF